MVYSLTGVLLRGLLPPGPDPARVVRAPADLPGARARALLLVGPAAPAVVDLTAGDPHGDDMAEVDLSSDGLDVPVEDHLALTLRRIMRRLGAVSFGTVTDLLGLAAVLPRTPTATATATGLSLHRHEPGDPAATAGAELGEVLADAVLAALVRHRRDPAAPVLARALAHRLDPPAPGRPALAALPPPGSALLGFLGAGERGSPVVAGTRELLCRLAAVTDPAVLLLPQRPAPSVWAQHMHDAAWAVETTGRTRLAAAAQLELLRCLHAVGVDGFQHLAGVWNTCSAAVQVHVVADVLGADPATVLSADLLDQLRA